MMKYNRFNVKFLSVISYIGPLFIVGKFSLEKECDELKFHNQQGEILFFTMSLSMLLTAILDFTLCPIFEPLNILCYLLYIGITVAWLILIFMGIISVFSKSNSYLPLVGDLFYKIKKK